MATANRSTRWGVRRGSPATRTVAVPAPEDLELAADDALLQLRIGRGAHLYAVVAAAVLALDGVLLLFLYPQLPTLPSGVTGGAAVSDSFYLLMPLAAALAVASAGVATKWETYQLWPWETHFALTIGSLAAGLVLGVVYGLRVVGSGGFASLDLMPWFYIAGLAAISLAFLGILLTWTVWDFRHWAAAIAAIAPIATSFLILYPPATATGASAAFAVSLYLSAILVLIAGSIIHLISSGTEAHERALITTGQSRIFRLSDEIGRREEAVQFREAALVRREADVENGELSIRRQNESLQRARLLLDDFEESYHERSEALVVKERSWAGQLAQIDARERLIDDKSKALELREQEVQRLIPQISGREQRLVEQEGSLSRREVAIAGREHEVAQRTSVASVAESRLDARTKELERQSTDLLRREGELAAGLGASVSSRKAEEFAASAREAEIRAARSKLDDRSSELDRLSRQLADRRKTTDDLERRTAEREVAISGRESVVSQREAELSELLRAADERKKGYDHAAEEYQSRLQRLRHADVESAERSADLARSLQSISTREASLTERERSVQSSLAAIEIRERQANARERALAADEAEVSLRRQEARRSGDLPLAGLAAMAVAEHWDGPVRSPTSEGEAAVFPPERATETLTPTGARRFPDRQASGTPRLDDLLLGGIPPAAHVVVVGDPFVGKEVVIYSFLAEGLKRGEPVVIVTASRPPSEVSESFGVVLPQLREYEQLGMVRWIDTSGSGSTGDLHCTVTRGPGDHAGLLAALEQASADIAGSGGAPFRVGVLGLSSLLAGNEIDGNAFVQSAVGTLKPRRALAMYSLEPGALTDTQVEHLLNRMDGAILFRQDRDRTFVSVKGFGEVQTRDWVECRATARSLIVGSFSLERIR